MSRLITALILFSGGIAFGGWISYLNYLGLIDRPLAVTLVVTEVPIGLLVAWLVHLFDKQSQIPKSQQLQKQTLDLTSIPEVQPQKPTGAPEGSKEARSESSREDTGNRKLTRVEAHNIAKDDAVAYLSGTEAHSVGASYEPVREIIEDGELRYLIEGIAHDRNQRKWRFQICVTQDRKVIPNHSFVFPIN